ncbi:MAG: GGDEF domain-containing protein, partial [Mesorhizobium sp.]
MIKKLIEKLSSRAKAGTSHDIARRAMLGTAAGVILVGAYAWLVAPASAVHVLVAAAIGSACAAIPLAGAVKAMRQNSRERIGRLTSVDPLTNCMNRGAFMRRFDDLMLAPQPSKRPAGALLLINADNVRSINDRLGVDTGDEVLSILASTIRASVRATDFVGRLNGCQFGVFLYGATTRDAIT